MEISSAYLVVLDIATLYDKERSIPELMSSLIKNNKCIINKEYYNKKIKDKTIILSFKLTDKYDRRTATPQIVFVGACHGLSISSSNSDINLPMVKDEYIQVDVEWIEGSYENYVLSGTNFFIKWNSKDKEKGYMLLYPHLIKCKTFMMSGRIVDKIIEELTSKECRYRRHYHFN